MTKPVENDRASRFRSNLRSLLEMSELSQKDAAEVIGVPYKWLRKITAEGLVRVHPANEERLKAICAYFKLADLEAIWGSDINKIKSDSVENSIAIDESVQKYRTLLERFPYAGTVSVIRHAVEQAFEAAAYEQFDTSTLVTTKLSKEELKSIEELPEQIDDALPQETKSRLENSGEHSIVEDHSCVDEKIDRETKSERESAEWLRELGRIIRVNEQDNETNSQTNPESE